MSTKLTPTITMWHRRDWGAMDPKREMTGNPHPNYGFVHHTTDKLAEYMDTLAEMKACVRAIQRFHMLERGYSDIAYHYIVFQPWGHREYARVFQGRLPMYVPAAQLGFNTGTIAIAVVGNFDGDDPVKRNTRHAVEVVLARHPSLITLGGHRDAPGQSTECPGDAMERWVPQMADAANLRVFSKSRLMGSAPEALFLDPAGTVI